MPTIQEEKPAKPRSRSRKADRRGSKGGRPQVEQPQVDVTAEPAPVATVIAEPEVTKIEPPVVETVSVEALPAEALPVEALPVEALPAVTMEKISETALSGEVLPPEVHAPASGEAAGLQAIAQAYGEYTRKSWLNGRLLAERLIAVRSFDEAIEIQGEFAKQAYANFLTHSERICVLYGEFAQQFFRPLMWRL